MSTDYFDFDMDAARREEECPDGIRLVYRGEEFILPAELPLDVFDAVLSKEFDLAGIFGRLLESDDDKVLQSLLGILIDRPGLPAQTLEVVHASLESLFGPEDYQRFRRLRPSIKDVMRLARGLFERYGTDLGEAFASADSSDADGPTSKQTSPATTPESTPDVSGADEEPAPASSE